MKPLNGLSKAQAKAWLAEISKPLTSSERVRKLRQTRADLGLKRLEVAAYPEDWPAIKTLAERLQRRRARLVAKRAP